MTKTVDDLALDRPEPIVPTGPTPTIANTGFAEPTFFEHAPAYSFRNDVATITLTAERPLMDSTGAAYKENVITGILKAPLGSLLQLRDVIDGVVRLRDEAVAAAAAAVEAQSNGTAH